jgi:hypothetical protein
VVQNVRLAPEFVFLAKGNQGFLHQFSRKKGIPQFCAREDVGKRVSVLLDSGGNGRNVQYVLLEPTTDNAVCTSGGTQPESVKNNAVESPTSRSETVDKRFQYVVDWFHVRKAAKPARDPKRFKNMTLQQELDETADSDEEDLSVSPPENASPLELLRHDSDLLYSLTTKAHRHYLRVAKSGPRNKQVKDEWSALLMNVFDRLPNPKDWTHISENSVRFQSIHKNIEKYSEQLVNLLNGLANHGLRATAGSAAPSQAAAGLRATGDLDEEDVPLLHRPHATASHPPPPAGSAAPSPAAAGPHATDDSDEDIPLSSRAAAQQRAGAGAGAAARPAPVHEDVRLPLRPCDARAGDYVEIFWAKPIAYIGWWKATVQVITSKGMATVIYEATPGNNSWDHTIVYKHTLAASKHVTNVGETHHAWKHAASRIDAGRTAASTRSKEVSCPHSW